MDSHGSSRTFLRDCQPYDAHEARVDGGALVAYVRYVMYEKDEEHPRGHVRVSDARQDLAQIINRVAYRGERVRLVRHGREVAAIVPIEDVSLLEAIEDELDLAAAREALADPENAVTIPWEQVKADLGL